MHVLIKNKYNQTIESNKTYLTPFHANDDRYLEESSCSRPKTSRHDFCDVFFVLLKMYSWVKKLIQKLSPRFCLH